MLLRPTVLLLCTRNTHASVMTSLFHPVHLIPDRQPAILNPSDTMHLTKRPSDSNKAPYSPLIDLTRRCTGSRTVISMGPWRCGRSSAACTTTPCSPPRTRGTPPCSPTRTQGMLHAVCCRPFLSTVCCLLFSVFCLLSSVCCDVSVQGLVKHLCVRPRTRDATTQRRSLTSSRQKLPASMYTASIRRTTRIAPTARPSQVRVAQVRPGPLGGGPARQRHGLGRPRQLPQHPQPTLAASTADSSAWEPQ
jgi:hypothetical protein